MKKKKIIIIVLILLILIIPIPIRLKDSGTTKYVSILYTISKVRDYTYTDKDYGYLYGTRIKILGYKVYDNTKYIVMGEFETGDIDFKNYIENELKNTDLIDNEKFESLNIYKIVNHGYYLSNEDIKYYEISFEYSCKEDFKGCIYKPKSSTDMPNTYYMDNYGIIWATVKNNEVIEFNGGFVTYMDSDFKVLEEVIYSK